MRKAVCQKSRNNLHLRTEFSHLSIFYSSPWYEQLDIKDYIPLIPLNPMRLR